MSLEQFIGPRQREVHYPALPPSHPAFRPIFRAICEMQGLKGPAFAARLCRSTGKHFDKILSQSDECDLCEIGGYHVNMTDLAEMADYLFNRMIELEAVT
jgi:hypothetical protein